MRIEMDVPAEAGSLAAALEGLTAIDREILARNRIPPLYRAGVRYRREPHGSERWRSIPEVLGARTGDCEDLAAWRAAELQANGERARAIAVRSGERKWHAVVRREDGRIEDPSRVLGLGSPREAVEGSMGTNASTVRWTLRRKPDGWEGEIVLPLGVTTALSRAQAPTKGQALSRAAALASSIASNPLLQAVLPPQAQIALKATRLLAKAAKAGKLLAVAKRINNPAARKLLRALF